MAEFIPIKLAEAALDALETQGKLHIEAHQQTKAELAVWRDAATTLASLADRAFYYSREDRASADSLIKTIRTLKQ